MDRVTEDFITKYLKELREDNAAVFIGAGLSKAAGYVDWPGLMSGVAEGLGLDIAKESDLVALAQYHLNSNATNRQQLSQLLVEEFSDLKEPSESHKILSRLPLRTYWTTNYDRLMERTLEAGGKRVDVKYTTEQLATTRRGRDAVIYKMHGDIEHPSKAILSKDDYERYHQTHSAFITALSGDLVEKTFLFLGFSFTDPNLDFILSRIRTTFTQHARRHFCITKNRTQKPGEAAKDYEYALTKQNLMTADLLRFNIRTIFVENFSEIPFLLRVIYDRLRRNTIFISGSAADYGAWGQPRTDEFVVHLAATLIDRDFRITSGFGLGIGGAVVSGAVQQIYSTQHRSVDEQLILRPFPVGIIDPEVRKVTFARYREELIAQAGIGIFIMGNKMIDGKVVDAEGVRAEFQIAKERNLYLLPVGASGSAARELWKEVMEDINNIFGNHANNVRPLLEQLGVSPSTPLELVAPLLKIIELLAVG